MKYLDIDYETKSKADIFVVGAAKYAKDSSTRILMCSFSMDGEQITNYNPYFSPNRIFKKLTKYIQLVKDYPDEYKIRAQNAEFEYWITNEVATMQFDWPEIPMSSFYCTMSVSGGNSYPAALEKAGLSMDLLEQKDKQGFSLINFFSKPSQKAAVTWNEPILYRDKFFNFIDYCDQDVLTQMHIVDHCIPLNDTQNRVLAMTEEMNVRGLPINKSVCEGAIELVKKYKLKADIEIKELTDGEVSSGSQTKVLQQWLNKRKAKIPNLKAETIERKLADKELDPLIKKVLTIRSNVSKSSTAKFTKALEQITDEGRVHGFIKAYLTITGRWAGRGLQIHNFSKPGKDFPSWCDYELLAHLISEANLELIELLYGDVMGALKAATRSMIQAIPGYIFYCADYSQIEARIVLWMAGDAVGLNDFTSGIPVYENMAARIFGVSINKIGKPSFERDVGKEVVLGCGFGMAWKKFQSRCVNQRNLNVSSSVAKEGVKAYKERYKKVPLAWKECEAAAKKAIWSKGKSYRACNGKLVYKYCKNGLRCKLPSGRFIYYPDAKVGIVDKEWGPTESVLYKQWNDKSKVGEEWSWKDIWGGTFFQHAVQGTAGDIMANGMLNAEKEGYTSLFTVHDEALAMIKKHFGSLKHYIKLLCTLPDWAKGMPIIAEGWEGPIYKK